jgi:hypothetical protein
MNFVSNLLIKLGAAGLVVMTAIISWQVFGRFVLNSSPSWSGAYLAGADAFGAFAWDQPGSRLFADPILRSADRGVCDAPLFCRG